MPSVMPDVAAPRVVPVKPGTPYEARRGGPALLLLFASTLFVSAFLLFCVQPMMAKMILPLLGGSPAVWNTCMVFFQAALLAGYAYAHGATARPGLRVQIALHVGLLSLPLLLLPVAIARDAVESLPHQANPVLWLLGVLLVSVGLPFFVVSTSAPLLQRWFAGTGHPSAQDPYFLYGASNLGSMLALLGYPTLVEPHLSLEQQSWLWAAGYGLLVMLTLGCMAALWRARVACPQGRGMPPPNPDKGLPPLPGPSGRLTVGRRLRWVALAFVPSSMMLAVTAYLSNDIAAVPLLWVIPLALYLLSFVLVFARRPIVPHAWMVRTLPLLAASSTVLILVEAPGPILMLVMVHLLTLFVAAMVCHGELARDRPPAEKLTEFYLWMSVGGVLGGVFNTLVAPLVFSRVVEYPLAVVLACLFRPRTVSDRDSPRSRRLDLALPLALGALTAGLVLGVQALGLKPSIAVLLLLFGLPVLLWYSTLHRPVRFALGIGAILLAGALYPGIHGHLLYRERSFFGVSRVAVAPDGKYRLLVHGGTVHGRQSLDPARRREPLAYYHRSGPIGQVLEVVQEGGARRSIAVVGLGTGSMACYAEPDEQWTFYEIDPVVEQIARDPNYFTFLQDSRAGKLEVVLGDARLRLREARDGEYGLIVLDAFSSDAIPVHLLTREALGLYLSKLAKGGMLAFHISNRYLDLKPALGGLARDAGVVAYARGDLDLSSEDVESGKNASQWVVMARRKADLSKLVADSRWQPLRGRRGTRVWTDDFSNILSALKWK
jgi:hypothetical protein